MPPLPQAVPAFEVDSVGNLTHINGAPLPGGLLHTVISPGIAATAPLIGNEWTIDVAYSLAQRLRSGPETKDI
jgi:hypothetical protein